MALGKQHLGRVVEHRCELDAGRRRVGFEVVLEDQREIQFGGLQLPEGRAPVDQRVAHVQLRVTMRDVRFALRRQDREGGEEHPDPDTAGLQPREGGDLRFRDLQAPEHRVDVRQEHLPGLGGSDTLPSAPHELDAELQFQQRDLARDRRLREREGRGRRGEGPVLDHGAERRQLHHIQHARSLGRLCRVLIVRYTPCGHPYGVERVGCALIFGLAGGLLASFAARIPAVQERTGLSDGALGLAFLALEAGAVLGLPLGGALTARVGSKRTLRLGFVVYSAGLAGVAWVPFAALFVCAVGTSCVDVAMNTQGVEIERRSGRRVLSRFHAAHSVGVLCGGLGGTAAAALALPVHTHLAAISAIGLLVGLLATLPLLDGPRTAGPLLAVPRGRLLAIGGIAFCAFLVDGAANNWSAVHVRGLGAGEGVAAAAFAAFASGLVIGRLIADRGDAALVLRRSGLLAGAGMLIALLSPAAAVAVGGWFLVGFGVAPVAPTVMRATGGSPASIAAVTTVGYLGSFTGPPLIGGIASLTSVPLALTVVIVAALAVAVSARQAAPRP